MHRAVARGGCRAVLLVSIVAGVGAAGTALAVDFPVAGTLMVNGDPGVLPAGGVFAGSDYDPLSGMIAPGRFTFPVSTETTESGGVVFVVRYQFVQTDTSSGAVAADGIAALTPASFKLTVLSITAGGIPFPIGVCEMQPILVGLAGTAAAAGLQLADEQFDIPEVPPGQCGSFRDSFNEAFAGADNSMNIQVSGDFTPPSTGDVLFDDGFEALLRMVAAAP